MIGRSLRPLVLISMVAVLGGCHRYYLARASIPLAVPVDTSCLDGQLTGSGYDRYAGNAVGGGTSVSYGTPAMFQSEWSVIEQGPRTSWRVAGEALVPDSSAVLSEVNVQIDRRFEPEQAPGATTLMIAYLFDLRDRCGGQSPGDEPLFTVEVDDAPYRAWSVRGSNGRVAMRLTADSLRYTLLVLRDGGRYVLHVDTLAADASPRHPQWVEVDSLVLPTTPEGTIIATDCWRGDASATGTLIAHVPRTRTRYFIDASDAWQLETDPLRIRSVPPEGIECFNPEWVPIIPGAPRAHRDSALTFRPSPGKARIYAFLSAPDRPLPFALPQVAVDSLVVGTLDGGSFLMVEIEPGPHRVGAPSGKHESFALLDAAPDSAYFFELRKELWAWSWRANIRPMDAQGARDAIRRAHMVLSSWPVRPQEARD